VVRALQGHEAMQNLKVSGDARRGWRVLYVTSLDSDSPVVTYHHFALFADRRDAEALLVRVRRAGVFRLRLSRYWWWKVDANQVTGFAEMANPPTVVLEGVPRPSTRGGAGCAAS
jgi:hypothetical protein